MDNPCSVYMYNYYSPLILLPFFYGFSQLASSTSTIQQYINTTATTAAIIIILTTTIKLYLGFSIS